MKKGNPTSVGMGREREAGCGLYKGGMVKLTEPASSAAAFLPVAESL